MTPKLIETATHIDTTINNIVAKGGTDETILENMYDLMEPFKYLMDTTQGQEMDELLNQYDGLYRFAKLLEQVAKGIAEGTIQVPKDH